MHNYKLKKKGFTLAEILVTLGVIGVIASITVPTLVQDVQDAQYKTAWKKTFADLNQVTKMIMQDNVGSLKGVFSGNNALQAQYLKYLNYTKLCPESESKGNCWHNSGSWKYMNGNLGSDISIGPTAILNNGVLLDFANGNIDCSRSFNECGAIILDVNGFKGPNTVSKDIFYIHILPDSIKPYGSQDDGSTCSGGGAGCSAQYLYQ